MSNTFQVFLLVSDGQSCTVLLTRPSFYIAQAINSDNRCARFQGLQAIMVSEKVETKLGGDSRIGRAALRSFRELTELCLEHNTDETV